TVFQPIGVEVTHGEQFRDILISNYATGDSVTFQDSQGREITTDAKNLLLRYRGAELVKAEAVGFTRVEAPGISELRKHAYLTGKVELAEEKSGRGTIQVRLDGALVDSFGAIGDASQLEENVAIIGSRDYPKPSSYY